MMEPWEGLMGAIVICLIFIGGCSTGLGIGESQTNVHWEQRLVDDRSGIAEIRSAVMLQREAKRLRERAATYAK